LLRPDPDSHRAESNPPRSDLQDPLQLGVTIVGVTAAFGGIGWWLDSRLHTFPFLMALGAVLGLFGILYVTYKRLRESDRKDAHNSDLNRDEHPPVEGA